MSGISGRISLLVIGCLIILLTVMDISYSYFVLVSNDGASSNSFNTGNLEITIQGNKISSTLLPTNEVEFPKEQNSTPIDYHQKSTISLNNTGNVLANYRISLSRDALPEGKTLNDLLSYSNLYVGIYDQTNSKWYNLGSSNEPVYYKKISNLELKHEDDIDKYILLYGSLEVGYAQQYDVYVWLSDETSSSEIGKLVYLKINAENFATESNQIEAW